MPSLFLILAERVLERERKALRPKEIVDRARDAGWMPDNLAGKTPHQTMKAKLSVDVRRRGENSIFVRTEPGRFYLRRLLDQTQSIYLAPPLRPPASREQVLVFRQELLDQLGRFQGLDPNPAAAIGSLLTPQNCSYLDRDEAETSDEFKQVLTYILVTDGSRVLSFKRGTYNRVAEFLKGSQCIGFGGHVTAQDRNLFTPHMGLLQSATRELQEELALPRADRAKLSASNGLNVIGVINDDSSDAGRRHFAFVLRYQVSSDPSWDNPRRGEKAITQLQWLAPAQVNINIRNYEYWSQLCLRHFYADVVRAQPSYRLRRRAPLTPPHLLCLHGGIGSGKTQATRLLTEDYGYHEVNSGRVVAGLLGIPPVPETPRDVFQSAAQQFIASRDGPGLLADALLAKARETNSPRVLIDGIRQRSTMSEMKRMAQGLRIGRVFVYTPPDVAFHFYSTRSDRPISISEFLRLRDADVEREVESMIDECDAIIYNWMGKHAYLTAIYNLMAALGLD